MTESESANHALMASTPEKRSSHRNRCLDCPCQQFGSDDAVTSAVNSDARIEALIDWLSSAVLKNNDGNISSTDKTKPCPNRLHASFVILNAIRDACRPFLESSSQTPINSPSPNDAKNADHTLNENSNYEEAFPSLSSAPSTAAPTTLVGRKKSKGPKKNNPSLSSGSSAAPTMLVGRKKNKGLKNDRQSLNGDSRATAKDANIVNKSQIGAKHSNTRNHNNRNNAAGVSSSKSKKRIKPVTISLSSPFPPLSTSGKSPKIEGNISSLPSQDTSDILGSAISEIPLEKEVHNKLTAMKLREAINGCSALNMSESTDAELIESEHTAGTCPNSLKSRTIEGNTSLPSHDAQETLESATVKVSLKNEANKPTNTKSLESSNRLSAENEIATSLNISSTQQLKRLVMVYATILRAHLVPFLLLEFHLLVRLISLSDKSNKLRTAGSKTLQPFADIFQFGKSCQDFAAETLSSVESVIVNMGHETIKMFVALPALQSRCPGLCKALNDVIFAGNSALIFETDQKSLGSNTNTAYLTLPFHHARDSRHNFRSVDLNKLFKEREELRDSFLYQLRAFQDVRGRLMEHAQAEKHIGCIRHQSREMLKNLSSGNNTLWFVNFFCDLLLQIGLVPVSETDSEVLKQIGDKKRLQKLHMRFTSKSGQTNKSSRKLHIDQKGPSTNSNITLPEKSFPGHQEFFSIFLRAGDSYKFNVHLKHRLAQIITEMTAVNETKGLCEHMAKTQMLAKFLGMLVFSPNWNLFSGNDTADLTGDNMDINLPPINIKQCIEGAWVQSRLVIVIPWVVQFLGMMKWDDISVKSQYYIDIFTVLWSINHYCLPYQIKQHSYHQTNMIRVSLQLGTLFHDIVGLAPAQNLPILAFPTRKSDVSPDPPNLVPFDDIPLWFSKPFLFPSIPYLKDLCELIKDLSQNLGKMSVTASARKLRPNTVTNLGGIDSSQKFVSRTSFSGENMSPWSTKRPVTPKNKGGIKEMLVDSFFHQHKDLQQLCEMLVDRAMKNFSQSVSQVCIRPIFKNGATSFEEYFNRTPVMTLEEYMGLLKALEADASGEATAMMNDDFDRMIKGTLRLLAPRETKSKVVEVACSLAISHASKKGCGTIRSIISEERKKLVEEFVRKEKKSKAGVPTKRAKKCYASRRGSSESNDSNAQSIIDFTSTLRTLTESDGSLGYDMLENVKEEKAKIIHHLQKYFIGDSSSQFVAELELQIISMLREFFSSPSPKSILSLQATIEAVGVLSILGALGYEGSSRNDLESLLCDTSNILKLIDQAKCAKSKHHQFISHDTIGNFLFVLVEGSLISHRALEKALIQLVTVNNDAEAVSFILLDCLASRRAGTEGAADGTVAMVRLRKLLHEGSVS